MHRKPYYKPYYKYPIRICRSLHDCSVCGETIKNGQHYYDGGYCRRAHFLCVTPHPELIAAKTNTAHEQHLTNKGL